MLFSPPLPALSQSCLFLFQGPPNACSVPMARWYLALPRLLRSLCGPTFEPWHSSNFVPAVPLPLLAKAAPAQGLKRQLSPQRPNSVIVTVSLHWLAFPPGLSPDLGRRCRGARRPHGWQTFAAFQFTCKQLGRKQGCCHQSQSAKMFGSRRDRTHRDAWRGWSDWAAGRGARLLSPFGGEKRRILLVQLGEG